MLEVLRPLGRVLRLRKRGAPRERRDNTVYLFDRTGLLGPARMLDESDGGARLECPAQFITDGALLLNVNTGQAHAVQVAWTEGRQVGLRYTKSTNIRGFVGPEWDTVKTYWTRLELGRTPGPARAAFR